MPGSGFAFTLCYRGVRLELPPPNSYTLIPIVTIRKRQVTAACDSSPGIASLELRLI